MSLQRGTVGDVGNHLSLCSHAILRYLAQKHKTPDHWYPADLERRAKVDQYVRRLKSSKLKRCIQSAGLASWQSAIRSGARVSVRGPVPGV